MSQSKVKAYRRTVEKESQKHYREYIFKHMDNLCAQPFTVRFHFMWKVIRGINPHTGKKVK